MQGEPSIEVALTREGDDATIRVSGEVDLATSPKLRDACLRAITESAGPVTIDLGEVTFLDSSGISVLVQAHQRLGAEGRVIRIDPVSAPVRRVIEISGLAATFALGDG